MPEHDPFADAGRRRLFPVAALAGGVALLALWAVLLTAGVLRLRAKVS